jgi:hypothetical protein
MAHAEVISTSSIPVGVTKPRKVLLAQDGGQMNAIFRDVDLFKRSCVIKEGVRVNFRDSALFELAAYRLSLLLGMDCIPPTVARRINGRDGTLQAWVEEAMTEKSRVSKKLAPPEPLVWVRYLQIMYLFDNLTFNDDRNAGNILIDKSWRVWLIDATRSFGIKDELQKPDSVRSCERDLWHRLKSLDDETIAEKMEGLLVGFEIRSLLRRRAKLVELIQGLIDRHGEKHVLFDFSK